MSLFDVAVIIAILLAAFIPALAALIWLRSGERGRKERWEDLFMTFLFGAVVAVIIATLLELAASAFLFHPVVREYEFFARDPSTVTFIIIIVIAPFVEEFAKLMGVRRFSRYIWRPRNGLIFGAAAGLGFAATENFLYEGTAFFEEGFAAFLTVAFIRSISSALMHASATSVSGYGYARSKIYQEHWWPYFLLAVAMHSSFNLFASFGELFTDRLGPAASVFGLVFSLALVFMSVLFLRHRLHGYKA
jgi:RsiW-degrading membrane proteinase PrsW (M82 family)